MSEDVKEQIHKYPGEVQEMFLALKELIDSVSSDVKEKLWAKIPSYYVGERFVRLIPFKDHINVEAAAAIQYKEQLAGFKFTPKGMVQVFTGQELPRDVLRRVFQATLLPGSE